MHPKLQGTERLFMVARSIPQSEKTTSLICFNQFRSAASEASEAIKRLQFHYFGTTFGASDAPGHGASVYDGLRVDFEN